MGFEIIMFCNTTNDNKNVWPKLTNYNYDVN